MSFSVISYSRNVSYLYVAHCRCIVVWPSGVLYAENLCRDVDVDNQAV